MSQKFEEIFRISIFKKTNLFGQFANQPIIGTPISVNKFFKSLFWRKFKKILSKGK
jgi:hypothetical protein